MNRIYKLSFLFYRIILISIIPVFFISKFAVGSSGHNSDMQFSDYLLLLFSVFTSILFFLLNEIEVRFKKLLIWIIVCFISASICFLFTGLFDFWKLYQKHNFFIGDTVSVVIVLALIMLSMLVLIGFLKNRFQKEVAKI